MGSPSIWVGGGIRVGHSVSQVDGDSDILPSFGICGRKVQHRYNGFCLTSVWEKAVPSALARLYSFSYVPGAFQAGVWE